MIVMALFVVMKGSFVKSKTKSKKVATMANTKVSIAQMFLIAFDFIVLCLRINLL